MAIKFKTKKEFKIVNRCLFCGKVIPSKGIVCSVCSKKNIPKSKKNNWLDLI